MKKDVVRYGNGILKSPGMRRERKYIQHSNISCYTHSVNVAALSIAISRFFGFKVDERSMVRGALLHDYFLYDWHLKRPPQGLHGFVHAKIALRNAERDFSLNDIERNIISKHMFPLNIKPPKYKESFIVCLADKLCALKETLSKYRAKVNA